MKTKRFLPMMIAAAALGVCRSACAQAEEPIYESKPQQRCQTCETASPKLGGQMFFRFGRGFLTDGSRAGGVFTDAGGAGGLNDGTRGLSVGFGLDLPLFKDPWFGNTVVGEMLIDYAQFSDRQVLQTTSVLLGAPTTANVSVSQLALVAAPKYRFELGQLRPWIVPVGMAFLLTGPPTNDTTYLDVGVHFGVGIDYMLTEDVSIGADWRYHVGSNAINSSSPHFMTAGGYLGFNF